MNKARVRILSINLVLLLAVVGAGFWGYSVLHPKAAPVSTQTATVSRGDVMATVSATGKVISPSDVGLAPLVAGTLLKLNVKVGDHVMAGDILAQIDTTNLTTALTSASATLVNAKNAVAALVPTKTAAEQAQADLQLSQAQAALALAKKNQSDNTALTQANAATYQASVDAAKKSLDDATANAALAAKTYQSNVDAALLTYNNYVGLYGPAGITVAFCTSINTINANCTTLMADYSAWQNALASQTSSLLKDKQNLDNLTTAYNNALLSQKNNLAKDAVTIAGYANTVQSAQNTIDNLNASTNVAMQPAKQAAVDSAQAQLANAQAAYDQAKRNLDGATIKAPVSGDVASISTAVGGNVPTTSAPATITANATGFIVLTNVSSLEVTGSFSEADAAKIKAGQSATYTFDALSGTTATGKVLGIDLLPTTSGGVTSFNATFAIDGTVSGLKPGMTATPTVQVGVATGVINVTAQAVTTRGNRSTVNLVTKVAGKQVLTPTTVVVGLKGDSTDEIQAGLKVGDVVALPSVVRTTSTNGFAVGGVPGGLGGAAALGGGGFGGGGGGGGRGAGGGGGG
jgi:multidrug efflux pump subunit AcrA (membrane-fusion protein)